MLDKELRKFGAKVLTESRKNLKKSKISASDLGKSIKFKVEVKKSVTSLTFTMNDYWEYVDAGVRGVGGTKANGEAWKVKKVTNNKFKYRDKMPPAKAFSGFMYKKGIQGRNKKGQFISRKSTMFAIAKSVYHTGIKTTNFFTDAFYDQIDKVSSDLGDALVLEIEDKLEESLVNDNIIIK